MYAPSGERVAAGESLPDVLADDWAAEDNELIAAARVVDTEAEAVC